MKKLIVFTICLISLSTVSEASIFSLFGKLLGINTKKVIVTDGMNKEMSDIKAGVNDVKAGINDVKGELGVIKDNVVEIKTNVKINANATVTAQGNLGYKNTNTNQIAGGNQNINDTDLMKDIVGNYKTIIIELLIILFFVVRRITSLTNKLIDLGFKKDYYESKLKLKVDEDEWEEIAALKDRLKKEKFEKEGLITKTINLIKKR